MRTRPLPDRKTFGTSYNLRPDTERVPAATLRVGDIVVESDDHPAVITRIQSYGRTSYRQIYARYIWSATAEPAWQLGIYHPDALLNKARKGEY